MRHNPTARHPGFEKVKENIAEREGVSEERAGKILGAATRRNKRGPAGKANPHLKRVKG